jgi:hypothetical protein
VERQTSESFEDEDGCAVTATSARHVEMLRNCLTPEVSPRGIELSTIWFQQDGATAHAARTSKEVVREIHVFPKHVFSLLGEFHGLYVRLIPLPVTTSFRGTSKRKCTPLNHGPSMTTSLQLGSKSQRGEHWETCVRSWKSAYAMMGNILVTCSSKRNRQSRSGIKWHSMIIHFVTTN